MGFFSWFFSKKVKTKQSENPIDKEQGRDTRPSVQVSVSSIGYGDLPVGQDEIHAAVERYEFVLEGEQDQVPLKARWWDERSHKKYSKEVSPKAVRWAEPFIPVEVLQAIFLQNHEAYRSPTDAHRFVKALRAVIRAKRKAKENHDLELKGLYGAAVLVDFSDALSFEYTGAGVLAAYLSYDEVQEASVEYAQVGYTYLSALGKMDVKWLVANFGEPAQHRQVADVLGHLTRIAITRYCWDQMRTSASFQGDIRAWLSRAVTTKLKIEKSDAQRRASAAKKAKIGSVPAALAATQSTFVIADLETTGLNPAVDDVIEYAAIRVTSRGQIEARFSTLVKISGSLPPYIVKLTGITDRDLRQNGLPAREALDRFLNFLGDKPVFFHNASFDVNFISQAAVKTGAAPLQNEVFDTLRIARQAWPHLSSHKLSDLAERVGAKKPTHRGSVDCEVTLQVLTAACKEIQV